MSTIGDARQVQSREFFFHRPIHSHDERKLSERWRSGCWGPRHDSRGTKAPRPGVPPPSPGRRSSPVKNGLSDYASNAKVTQDICRTGLPRGPGAAHLNLGFVISENRPPPRALVLDHRCRCPSAIPPRFRLIYPLDVRSIRAAGDGRSRRRARFVPSTGRETRLRPTGRPGVRLLAGDPFRLRPTDEAVLRRYLLALCIGSRRGSMMGSRTSFRVIGEGEQFLIVVPHGNMVREYFRVNDDPVLARVCCPVHEGQSRKLARRSPTRRRPQVPGNVVTPPSIPTPARSPWPPPASTSPPCTPSPGSIFSSPPPGRRQSIAEEQFRPSGPGAGCVARRRKSVEADQRGLHR